MMVKGRRIKSLGKFNVSDWSIGAAEDFKVEFEKQFEKTVLLACNEVLEHAASYGVYADFKGIDGRSAPKTLQIEVTLPLGEECEGPTWLFSLDAIIAGIDLMGDTYMPKPLKAVRDKLRELADRVDAVIKQNSEIYVDG